MKHLTNYEEIEKKFSPERRRRNAARAKKILLEEMTRRELRIAMDHTQADVAKVLGIKQEQVCRLEKRSDLLISTLRSYVKAMGGELDLVVKLPDHRSVSLSGFGEIADLGFKER